MKYLATFVLGVTLIFQTAACAPTQGDQETQSGGVASDVDEPKTVFQDTTEIVVERIIEEDAICLLYTSPSPRDRQKSRKPSSA